GRRPIDRPGAVAPDRALPRRLSRRRARPAPRGGARRGQPGGLRAVRSRPRSRRQLRPPDLVARPCRQRGAHRLARASEPHPGRGRLRRFDGNIRPARDHRPRRAARLAAVADRAACLARARLRPGGEPRGTAVPERATLGAMSQHDPRIDAYIAKAAPFAQPILAHIRALVHEAVPGVEETIKWGAPSFMHAGGILCVMAAFKQHAALNFWKGALLLDAIPEEGMGSFGKLRSVRDLPPKKTMLALLRKAAKL